MTIYESVPQNGYVIVSLLYLFGWKKPSDDKMKWYNKETDNWPRPLLEVSLLYVQLGLDKQPTTVCTSLFTCILWIAWLIKDLSVHLKLHVLVYSNADY